MRKAATEKGAPKLRDALRRANMRLVLLVFVVAALLMVVSGITILRNYEFSNLQLSGRSLAYAAAPAVAERNREAAAQTIKLLTGISSVEAASIYDANAKPIATWDRDTSAQSNSLKTLADRAFWPREYYFPITVEDRQVGKVAIRGNADALLHYTGLGILIALSSLGLVIIALRIAARRLDEDVVLPLEHIVENLGESKNAVAKRQRFAPTGVHEIYELHNHINDLLDDIERVSQRSKHDND